MPKKKKWKKSSLQMDGNLKHKRVRTDTIPIQKSPER